VLQTNIIVWSPFTDHNPVSQPGLCSASPLTAAITDHQLSSLDITNSITQSVSGISFLFHSISLIL